MKKLNKLSALKFITKQNPVCDDCSRGDLEQVRKAAGLYQLIKDVMVEDKNSYNEEELNLKITQATTF